MANIGIYREANKHEISTFNHLVNSQDIKNQDPEKNPNLGKTNLLIYVEDGEFKEYEFKRDGNNQSDIDMLHKIEMELDKEAREHYKEHKTKEKLANPDKKVRTVLQSPDLRKEFVLAIGGDRQIDESTFAEKVKKTVDAVMVAKGLDRGNIIGIFIHNDEKTTHVHCQYNDYSKQYCTTSAQHARPKMTKGMTKKTKSDLIKLQREEFGKFQDIVAENLGMERGEKGSKAKHLSKAQHFEKKSKEVEQLERTTAKLQKTKEKLQAEIKINQDMNLIINSGRDKAKKDMEEYQLEAQKAALELTKLNKTIDSKEIKLDALQRSINDVQLQNLSLNEPAFRETLF
ncbi:MAG: hypothetical protein QG594_1486, partial [Bacteroidota bacterium]|nr:hypothetical protein [Bacteroidota bacterium]